MLHCSSGLKCACMRVCFCMCDAYLDGVRGVCSSLFPVTDKMPGWGEVVFLCVSLFLCGNGFGG